MRTVYIIIERKKIQIYAYTEKEIISTHSTPITFIFVTTAQG